MKLGLSLSGGGVKGAAHIGVLKALEENNIKIDYIGGTSSGSIVATLYAVGFSPDEIYEIFKKYCKKIKYIEGKNILKLLLGLVTTGKIKIDGMNSGKSIDKLINKVCGEKNINYISDIKFPLVIPSVNMNTGEVICFTSKNIRGFSDNTIFNSNAPIGKAVEASCSFPVIFSPCYYENSKLLDGGIRENSPWREVKLLGADKVINVIFESEENIMCCDNFIDVAVRSFDLMKEELSKYEIEGTDYLIKLKSKKVSLLDMSKIEEFYQIGYIHTKEIINKLK